MKRILLILCLLISAQMLLAQLPSVQLKNLDGQSIATDSLSDGKRPLVLSFFATWCKPCLRELSAIEDVYQDWVAETNLRLVAISIDEGANSHKVKPLAKSRGWSFDILLDPNGDLKRALNVQVIPSVIVLSSKGKIIYRHTGYTDGSEEQIIEAIRKYKEE